VRKIIHANTIIGHHLVLMGYGHWLSNDRRGSGSSGVRAKNLSDLGDVHFGRKKVQTSRDELRRFYSEAEQLLEHETIWFDDEIRAVVADAFGAVVKKCGYTGWSGAVLQNHAHALLRVHRDDGHLLWERLALASRDALRSAGFVPKQHPVWSNRPYVVFKKSVGSVQRCIEYINDNFAKHRLAREIYPWITAYDGFPFHKKRK
jgi:hypothetical protein